MMDLESPYDLNILDVDPSLLPPDEREPDKFVEMLPRLVGAYKHRKMVIDTVAKEISRLQELKHVLEDRQESLQAFVGSIIGAGNKWSNGIHTCGWRPSERLEATPDNPDKIAPTNYIEEVIGTKVCTEDIRQAIKSGFPVAGWALVKHNNLQIK